MSLTRPPVPSSRAVVDRRLRAQDDYGIALALILVTVVALATFGDEPLGQFVATALGGGTLLFVLSTSGARRGSIRVAAALLVVGLAVAGTVILTGRASEGDGALRLIGLMLAFVAPVAIVGRLLRHRTITIRTVFGALCIYLLVGLAFSYVFPIVGQLSGTSFFVQVAAPNTTDYVYFSFVTLATVGYGDLTAASDVGRMLAVSEALMGQLYLVSAVALLVGKIGQTRGDQDPGGPDGRSG